VSRLLGAADTLGGPVRCKALLPSENGFDANNKADDSRMNTLYYLFDIEARQIFSDRRLAATQLVIEVPPAPVKKRVERFGQDPSTLDTRRWRRFSSRVAAHTALDYARSKLPFVARECYDYRIKRISKLREITTRVTPSANKDGCRIWLVTKQELLQASQRKPGKRQLRPNRRRQFEI